MPAFAATQALLGVVALAHNMLWHARHDGRAAAHAETPAASAALPAATAASATALLALLRVSALRLRLGAHANVAGRGGQCVECRFDAVESLSTSI